MKARIAWVQFIQGLSRTGWRIIFLGGMVPLAYLLRALNIDILRLDWQAKAQSYWRRPQP